jgi:hypothetical protein
MTYNDSVLLARKLKESSPLILGIELFGSVRRNGYGRDADFIILVDDELAKHWWQKERELVRVKWPDFLYEHRWIIKKFTPFLYMITVHNRRKKRLEDSAKILGVNLAALADARGKIPDFELFLFPLRWRIGTDINMDFMRQITDVVEDRNTLGFLKRIAREAVALQ